MTSRPPRRALLVVLQLSWLLAGCTARHVVGLNGSEAVEDGGHGDAAAGTCGAYRTGLDLELCTASYLASGARTASVAIAADESILVAGNLAVGDNLGISPIALMGGGTGALVRFDPTGRQVRGLTRVGEQVVDLEVDPVTGRVALAVNPTGLVVLTPDGRSVLSVHAGPAERVAASDGYVAALGAGVVTLVDPEGTSRIRFQPAAEGAALTDVALDAASATIVLTGVHPIEAGAAGSTPRFRSPLLTGHTYDGEEKWSVYGFTRAETAASTFTAASRGVRVTMGGDGRLYYLGQSEGGNSVHLRKPTDLGVVAPGPSSDRYGSAYAAGAAVVLFVGRFNASSGELLAGQQLVARDPRDGDAVADTLPLALAVDERGQVLVAGRQSCCLSELAARRVEAQAIEQTTHDGFVTLFSSGFTSRPIWTTWSTGGASAVTSVALRGGRGAMAALQTEAEQTAGLLLTHQAFRAAPAGSGDAAFFSVFPTPTP